MTVGGKQEQFQALVQSCSKDLYTFAYWLCGDPTIAEDLVQETFTRAWKSLHTLRDHKAARPWLIRILRRENARRFERNEPQLVDIDAQTTLASQVAGPEHTADRSQLHQAILALKPAYREPLLLQILEGFSYLEIAGALDLDIGVVMIRLHRAKRMLQRKFDSARIGTGGLA